MTRTLVAQAEARKADATGAWAGYEIFDVDGDFYLIVHISMYEGIKRSSHWASQQIKMDAFTKEVALEEAARKTAALVRAYTGAATADVI